MIVDAVIVPEGTSSTDGYVCAAGKFLEEPSFTDLKQEIKTRFDVQNHTALAFKGTLMQIIS